MFAASHNLWFLCMMPLIAGLFWLGQKKRQEKYRHLFSMKLIQTKGLRLPSQKKHIASILIALSLLIISIAEPQFGEKWQHRYQSNIDIVIALDLSTSMLANDIDPNRIDRAKQEIQLLLNKLDGHRIALIGFAQEAFTHVPPTIDHDIITLFLDELTVGIISSSGSQFEDLFVKASYLLRQSPKNEKVVIIVSDGELIGDTLQNSINIAKKNDITVMSIGVGSPNGAPVPNPTRNGIEYLKDQDGNLVISKLNASTLKQIATETNGTYAHSTAYKLGASHIYKAIKHMESSIYKNKQKQSKIPRYHTLIFIVLGLLLSDLWSQYSKPKTGGKSE